MRSKEEKYKRELNFQKDRNVNEAILQQHNTNPDQQKPVIQNLSPTHAKLSNYLSNTYKLSQKIESPPEENLSSNDIRDQRESLNSLNQYQQYKSQTNDQKEANTQQIQQQAVQDLKAQSQVNQQLVLLEKHYKEIFLNQERQKKNLMEENAKLQAQNKELLSLLTLKENRIDKLYQEINGFQQTQAQKNQEDLLLKNQQLQKHVQILELQLQQKQEPKVSDIQQKLQILNQLKNASSQSQSQKDLQYYDQQANQQLTQQDMMLQKTTPLNIQEGRNSQRQMYSYSLQPSARKQIQKLNISQSTQNNESKQFFSQGVSPKHNRQISIQTRSSEMRVPMGFDKLATSIVYRNTLVPYLGSRKKTRSRSPEKRGLEEICCPFLSGTEKR